MFKLNWLFNRHPKLNIEPFLFGYINSWDCGDQNPRLSRLETNLSNKALGNFSSTYLLNRPNTNQTQAAVNNSIHLKPNMWTIGLGQSPFFPFWHEQRCPTKSVTGQV